MCSSDLTCFDLAEHRGQKMTSMAAWAPLVQQMTLEEAEAIYKTKYASAIRFDDLPPGVDCCMMDYGVNSGSSRPIRVARAITKVPSGGGMNQELLDAVKKIDPVQFVHAMCAERLAFMHAIRGGSAWAEFGGGWNARVQDLQVYCDHAAKNIAAAAPPAPDLSHVVTPKAIHVAKTAGKQTTGGVIAGPLAAHAAGAPLWAVAAIAAAIVVAGIGYEAWQAHKTAAANNTVLLPVGA